MFKEALMSAQRVQSLHASTPAASEKARQDTKARPGKDV